MKKKSLLWAFFAFFSVSTLMAQNQVVSFFFSGSGLTNSDLHIMGVVPAGFFNRVTNKTVADKTDSKGWAYVPVTNVNSGDVFINVAPSNSPSANTLLSTRTAVRGDILTPVDYNKMLFTSGLFRTNSSTINAVQVNLTMNSTYSQNGYDLYVYYLNPTASRTNWVKYSIPGSDFYFSGATSNYPTSFVCNTALTPGSAVNGANYAKFESLTGTSLSLTITDQTNTDINTGLCGLQVVEKVPAPNASASLNGSDLVISWPAVLKRQGMNANDLSYKVNIYTKPGGVITPLVTNAVTTSLSYTLSNLTAVEIFYTVQSMDTYTQSLVTEKAANVISASSSGNGIVSGGGIFAPSATATITATPTSGYRFVNWTENGTQVSTSNNYSFTASVSRILVANFASNTVSINGSGNVDASTLLNCDNCDVIIDNGAALTIDRSKILKSITVSAGGKLTNVSGSTLTAASLNINSDANGTGTFVDNGTTGISGTVNVQQYLTGAAGTSARGWWYVASPVSGATSSVFDVVTGTNKLWYYAENADPVPAYTKITENGIPLNPGTGYVTSIGGADGTYTFSTSTGNSTSKLNTGDITVTPTRTGISATKRGFNLAGNPYPSFLDWNAVEKTNIKPTIWYRTFKGSVMQFDTYDGFVGTGNGTNGIVSQFIPPMQAFWVKVNSDGSNGSLVFKNAMRSHQDQSLTTNRLRARTTSDVRQVLRLKVSNGLNSDETLIVSNPNASDGSENYNSPKISNNNTVIPEIYTNFGDEELVITNLNAICPDKEVILGFRTGESNTFTIRASELTNFKSDTRIILRDNLLNTIHDLTDGSSYNFTSDVTTTNSRFSIVFKSTSLATGMNTSDEKEEVTIYKSSTDQIVVYQSGVAGQEGIVTISNATGQKLFITQTKGTNTVINKTYPSGVYFVTVQIAGRNTTKKIIIN